MKNHDPSRRKFAKKLAYAAPIILTLKAQPSFAAAGSGGSSRYSGDESSGSSGRRGRRGRGKGGYGGGYD